MSCVLDKLYMGGIDEASKPWKLQKCGLSHILTIDVKPLPLECREGFEYKYVHALDLESFDLLERLPGCIEYINKAREDGGVFVHCHAGQSRSATVVLAYIMQKMALSLADAMVLLQKLRPSIRPNPGFLSQLELFECMGNRIDTDQQQYKLYKLSRLASQIQSAHDKDALLKDNMAADPSGGIKPEEKFYKCRKCRRALFKHSAILQHTEGYGEAAFDWRVNQCTGDREDATVCQRSFFIEPVQWMAEDLLEIEGKLSCPKCSAKLGSFKWTGEKCPCGTWVTPAFHIQTNKVDQAIQRNITQGSRPVAVRPSVKPSPTFQIQGVGKEEAVESLSSGEQQSKRYTTNVTDIKDPSLRSESETTENGGENRDRNESVKSSLHLVSEIGDAIGMQDLKGDLPPL